MEDGNVDQAGLQQDIETYMMSVDDTLNKYYFRVKRNGPVSLERAPKR
jgi:hypothetical protein